MKKILFVLCVAGIALCSCSKDELEKPVSAPIVKETLTPTMYFNVAKWGVVCDCSKQETSIGVSTNSDSISFKSPDWVKVTLSDVSDPKFKKLTLYVDENTGGERSGYIECIYFNGVENEIVYVLISQDAYVEPETKEPETKEPETVVEELSFSCNASFIRVGSECRGGAAVRCVNNTSKTVNVLSINIYVDDVLFAEVENMPTIVEPGKYISYVYQYVGIAHTMYAIFTINDGDETKDYKVMVFE